MGGGYNVECIPSARDSEELKYIMDNAIVEGWHPAGYAHLTTFLHARDNGYKNFWNIDADDLQLCAKPRKVAKLLKAVKDYATEHAIDIFSLDAGGKTFSGGMLWNFGVSYAVNPARLLKILKEHCTDDDYLEFFERFGDVKNVDYFLNFIRLKNLARLEVFYPENFLMMNYHAQIYDVPLWGIRYWTDGRCHWSALEDFGMNDAASLPIPDDMVKFDVGVTLAESRHFLKETTHARQIALTFDIANGILDAGITLILPLDGSVEDVNVFLGTLHDAFSMKEIFFRELKFFNTDAFSNIRLIVTDAGLSAQALATCRDAEKFFVGRMKILTGIPKEKLFEAGLQAAKGRYVMFVNGSDAFHPESFKGLYEVAESFHADVIHLSNYVAITPDKNFSVEVTEEGWDDDFDTLKVLQSLEEKVNAWTKNMLQKSIYNKLIRRDFLEEEKIFLSATTKSAQWVASLQLLMLAEKYLRVPKPLMMHVADVVPTENQEKFSAIREAAAARSALNKLDDEVFYFDEYAEEKILLRKMYDEFLNEVFESKHGKSQKI